MGISTMNLLPWQRRSLQAVALIALVMPAASPLMAQTTSSDTEIRLRKVESEVAAIQRVVFPGGDGKFFPQLQSGTASTVQPGSPASAPSSDMLVRMDALEGQVARLTAQVEEDHHRIEKMDARLAAIEGASKVQTVTDAPASSSTDANLAAMGAVPKPVRAASSAKPASKPAAKPTADAAAKRVAAVKAVVKPSTRDAGDDEYSYGFRLWEAKFFPESEQQLKMFLQKYPKHARTSYARNLLGRDYLDDGNPHEAAGWFLQNYKTEPKGDRAPDSLLMLAESMRQLGDTTRGCVALKQFGSTFPAEASGRLKGQYDSTSSGLKCK